MKKSLPLLLIALLSSSLSFAALSARAEQPPPGGPAAPPPGMEKHGPPHPRFSAADRAAFFEAHLAGLHAGLQLTPEQEKMWPPVEAALRAGAKSAADRAEKAHNEPPPTNAIAWLRKLSEEDMAKSETLKALADAAAPLYQSLTEEQKHRLPFLLHGIRPHGWGPGGMRPGGMGMGMGGMSMGPGQHGEHGDHEDAEHEPD